MKTPLRSLVVTLLFILCASLSANAQTILWDQYLLTGSPFDSGGRAMTVDAAGNVYVTGDIWDGITGWHGHTTSNLSTLKYDTNGNLLWQTNYDRYGFRFSVKSRLLYLEATGFTENRAHYHYDSPLPGNDIGRAITTDKTGNVYVAGQSFWGKILTAGGRGEDWITLKYAANGHVLWQRFFSGFGNRDDAPVSIKIDSQGHVIVVGWMYSEKGNKDLVVIAYDTNGTRLWQTRYVGKYGDDVPTSVVLDSSDNIYICGYTYGGDPTKGGTGNDWLTLKYSPSGKLLWSRIYNGAANRDEQANAITLDSQGNVIVVGSSADSVDSNNNVTARYAIIKCGSDGHIIWGQRYLIGPYSSGSANAVAVDSHDNIILTGGTVDLTRGNFNDILSLKFDPNGALLWSIVNPRFLYGGIGTALIINGSDDIYIGGMLYDGASVWGG